MKKLLLLFVLSFGFASLHAQEKTHQKGMMKDCVMMENGKMMTMTGGKTAPMDKDMTMKNGTIVMTDGTVKMKNGKTMMLKNGDHVMMSGKVEHMAMKGMKHKMKEKS